MAEQPCSRCGYTEGHTAECANTTRAEYPAVGPVSAGHGELAGGDVQAVRFKKKQRKPSRHDQRTALPGDHNYGQEPPPR